MDKRTKMLVMGSLPAICGASATSALGEKINWPESVSAQPSFQAATQPAAPATNPAGGVLVLPSGPIIRISGARL